MLNFIPFSPDGTLKCRFENFLIFIWKGRGAQIPMSDATMRRWPDREQFFFFFLGTIVGQTQKSMKKTIMVAKGLYEDDVDEMKWQ